MTFSGRDIDESYSSCNSSSPPLLDDCMLPLLPESIDAEKRRNESSIEIIDYYLIQTIQKVSVKNVNNISLLFYVSSELTLKLEGIEDRID